MENRLEQTRTTQTQNPSMRETSHIPLPLPFFPPRRSPLKSATFDSLVRFLSVFASPGNSPNPLPLSVDLTCLESSNSPKKKLVTEVNPNLIGTQNGGFSDGEFLVEESRHVERCEDHAEHVNPHGNLEFDDFLIEKGRPIADGDPKNPKLVDTQNEIFHDGGIHVGDLLGNVSRYGEHAKHVESHGNLEFDDCLKEKSSIADGNPKNPKMVDAQNEIFCDGGIHGGDLRNVLRSEDHAQHVDSRGNLEFDDSSIEKGPVADENPKNPKMVDNQNEIFHGGIHVGDLLGNVLCCEERAQHIDSSGNLEFDDSSIEKGSIADGNPKTPKMVATKSEIFHDGGIHVGDLLGNVSCSEERDESVHGSEIIALDTLSREKDPVIEAVDIENQMSMLGNGKRQECHNQFFDHCNGLKSSIASVQNDQFAEEVSELINNTQEDCFGTEWITMEELVQEMQDNRKIEFVNQGSNKSTVTENCDSVDSQDKMVCSGQAVMEELGHEMRQEGQALEKLISLDTITDSSMVRNNGEVIVFQRNDSASLIAGTELEDGEISDDLGVSNQSFDSTLEDVVASEDRDVEEQISDDFTEKGDFSHTCKGQIGIDEKDLASICCLSGSSDSTKYYISGNSNSWRSEGNGEESTTQIYGKNKMIKYPYGDESLMKPGQVKMGCNGKDGEGLVVNPSSLRLPGEASEKIMSQDQGTVSTVKDVEVREKRRRSPLTEERKAKKKDVDVHEKRKRPPLTEERKAKKKVAKKRKRAKMNKEQGVKRLRLQPISKPKAVNYCKYYLNGRCQQGDKCKFSHDTVPLTKSQPCKYFACHSCLKGEDCPFDHQLSKYPCNNYVSQGTCHRGDACLFSHKVALTEGNSEASKVNKTECLLPPEKTNSREQLNIDSASNPAINHLSKDANPYTPYSLKSHLNRQGKEHVAEVTPRKPPSQAPEGIFFLSFGQAPSDDTNNQNASEKLQNSNRGPLWSPGSTLSPFQSLNLSAGGHKSSPNSSAKASLPTPGFVQSPLRNGFSNASKSRSTDASKILEEFLFSGL
ncbi:CCCH-type zinc finger family protein [Tasmannia lanceolata]|uniref:CCCH-type zinc finger family protein n=1 Tax=Tasmannia lanceolata TaxID=3420 RepID=UPI004063C0DA